MYWCEFRDIDVSYKKMATVTACHCLFEKELVHFSREKTYALCNHPSVFQYKKPKEIAINVKGKP